jgi:hypothetical protein
MTPWFAVPPLPSVLPAPSVATSCVLWESSLGLLGSFSNAVIPSCPSPSTEPRWRKVWTSWPRKPVNPGSGTWSRRWGMAGNTPPPLWPASAWALECATGKQPLSWTSAPHPALPQRLSLALPLTAASPAGKAKPVSLRPHICSGSICLSSWARQPTGSLVVVFWLWSRVTLCLLCHLNSLPWGCALPRSSEDCGIERLDLVFFRRILEKRGDCWAMIRWDL